jgi:hypothetical protein
MPLLMPTITIFGYVLIADLMETQRYRVTTLQDPQGNWYRLDGPGLQMQRLFRGDDYREQLQDMAELMNFSFEQGRRSLDQQPTVENSERPIAAVAATRESEV